MRSLLRLLLGVFAAAVLCFSGYKLIDYYLEVRSSERMNTGIGDGIVKIVETTVPAESSAPTQSSEPEPIPEETVFKRTSSEPCPIEADFSALLQKSRDIVGWLYCADTPINLPVVQGRDNDEYLRKLIDGSPNNSGTLFIDFRNDRAFADRNTVIYGHNLKNNTLFGSLKGYRDQAYYDAHPVLWLLTPDADYLVELVAGFVIDDHGEIYSFPDNDAAMLALAEDAVSRSTFRTDLELTSGDRYVTLSTCAYDFDNARYVILGRLAELTD